MFSKTHKSILEQHRPELVDEIEPDSLLPELRKKKLLTSRQEDKVKVSQNYFHHAI